MAIKERSGGDERELGRRKESGKRRRQVTGKRECRRQVSSKGTLKEEEILKF